MSSPHIDPRAIDAVTLAAETLRIPLAPGMAERIASGAQAAVSAVELAAQSYSTRGVGEPSDYLGLLESLAPPAESVADVEEARALPHPGSMTSATDQATASDPSGDASLNADLCAAVAALRQQGGGCQALVERALWQASAMQAETRAWLSIDVEGARQRAEWIEAVLQQGISSGRERSPARDTSAAETWAMPLLGIPLAHKDMFNLPPSASDHSFRVPSCGSKVLSCLQSPGVATVIDRLSQAGAVTVGTLNMAEFAFGATGHNASRGDCVNAQHSDYISGGSSSGSAVAVARGAVSASLGSDTGGSIRIPAAVNGVLGLKPTYGLIPRSGSMRLAPSIDVIGPMARSVRDLARILQVVSGFDERDTCCTRRRVPNFEQLLTLGSDGLRVGVPDRYFFEEIDPEVRDAIDRFRITLERTGVRFKRVTLPDVSMLAELSRVVVYAEATGLHADMLRESADRYSPQVRLRASTGLGIPAPVYLSALTLRLPILEQFVTQVFNECDALLTPTIPIRVPTRAATDVGAGDTLWSILSRLVRCTAPFNYLGLPAISVPAGFDRAGLPIGAQLVARPFAESVLLRLAAAAVPQVISPVRSPAAG